jgi:hypothetical protein
MKHSRASLAHQKLTRLMMRGSTIKIAAQDDDDG